MLNMVVGSLHSYHSPLVPPAPQSYFTGDWDLRIVAYESPNINLYIIGGPCIVVDH